MVKFLASFLLLFSVAACATNHEDRIKINKNNIEEWGNVNCSIHYESKGFFRCEVSIYTTPMSNSCYRLSLVDGFMGTEMSSMKPILELEVAKQLSSFDITLFVPGGERMIMSFSYMKVSDNCAFSNLSSEAPILDLTDWLNI